MTLLDVMLLEMMKEMLLEMMLENVSRLGARASEMMLERWLVRLMAFQLYL
jgi:hypothetical protein